MRTTSRLASIAILVLILAVTSPAAAATTWEDAWTPVIDGLSTPVYFGPSWDKEAYQSFTYFHDLTRGGFDYGSDTVTSYSLSIGLADDSGCDWFEVAWIDLPGRSTDTLVEIEHDDIEIGFSMAGIDSLNDTGRLRVTISRLLGDFYLSGSELVAVGNSPSSVPVPGSLLLLGTGLIGLVGTRIRRAS